MFIAFATAAWEAFVKWLLGDLFKKPDPEAEKIKEDAKLLESIKNANEMADRIRNDPAERLRIYNAINKDK